MKPRYKKEESSLSKLHKHLGRLKILKIERAGIMKAIRQREEYFKKKDEEIRKERDKAQRYLSYQEQLRSLIFKLSFSEEQERRHLAERLDGDIGQTLAICAIKLKLLQEQLPKSVLRDFIEETHGFISGAIRHSRLLMLELSPSILYTLGLEAAVEWLVENMQKQYKIAISLGYYNPGEHIDDDIRAFLFRIVRELLFGVIKYAKARNADVSMRRLNDNMRIKVGDNGAGFKTSRLNVSSGKDRGFNLFLIREWLLYSGGQLQVKSRPGGGTQVIVDVPLKTGSMRL